MSGAAVALAAAISRAAVALTGAQTISDRPAASLRDDVRAIGTLRWCAAALVAIVVAVPTWVIGGAL